MKDGRRTRSTEVSRETVISANASAQRRVGAVGCCRIHSLHKRSCSAARSGAQRFEQKSLRRTKDLLYSCEGLGDGRVNAGEMNGAGRCTASRGTFHALDPFAFSTVTPKEDNSVGVMARNRCVTRSEFEGGKETHITEFATRLPLRQ